MIDRDKVRTETAIIAIALLVALAVGSVLILMFGESPLMVYRELWRGTLGNAYGAGQTLFKTTPLILTGLSVALAFRAGLFNIGAEGQLTAGAFATAIIAAALPAGTPAIIALPLAIAAGAIAGAIIGAIPGALRAYTGAHEVINTIMLNFIVAGLVLYLGNRGMFVSETTHTKAIVSGAQLPALGIHGSAANVSIVLAVGAAALVWWLLARSRPGFELRAVGLSPGAAENAGIDLKKTVIAAMAGAGALAGLVGSNYVLGYKGYFEEGMGRGVGFMGIAVALLGRNHPVGVVLAALLFGILSQGGFAIGGLVPRELVDVLQAVIILAIAATSSEVRRLTRRSVT